MLDSMTLGSSPRDEECIQVSTHNDYYAKMRAECNRYKSMLIKRFPNPPEGCYFRIKSNSHDFGTYMEVEIISELDTLECVEFMLFVERKLPRTWDDVEVLQFKFN